MSTIQFRTPHERTVAEVDEIARQYGSTAEELIGRNRARRLMDARCHAFYYVWQKYGSLPKTGKFFGGRDHSTIAYGIGHHLLRIGQNDHWMAAMNIRNRAKALAWHAARRNAA